MAPAIGPDTYPAYAAECGDPSRTKKLGFGRRLAILLVDVCSAYTSPGSPLCLPTDTSECALNAIARLLDAARATPDPIIIYAQTTYTRPNLQDAGLILYKTGRTHAQLFHTNDPGNQLALPPTHPRVHPKENDLRLAKKYASPFFGTNLASQLAALSIDTLLIGGFATSGGVRAAALDAMQSGFRPMVVAEACGDRGREGHWANLMDIGAKYGDVVSVEEALHAIKQGS